MTSILSSAFSVSLDDSMAFARLSGDYNPLHLTPGVARRTRFGDTVTHGIHLFLRALDELAAQGRFDGQEPEVLSATFDNAVLTGHMVSLRASANGNKMRVSAEAADRPAFTGMIELRPALGVGPETQDTEFAFASPNDVDFPPTETDGTVPLKLNRALLSALFPSVAALQGTSWVADLLATTQVVGMRCPGMHSIYSGFRLHRAMQAGAKPTSMHYRVSGMENRFRLLRIQVIGTYLAGTIEAFYRARPVRQRPMNEVAAVVPAGSFAGHRALIVGGSRGLGELTAKIVAAGGADVTITYARGKEDADHVCAEVRALGFACTAQYMDVMNSQTTPEWLESSRFSHIYFFASPLITRGTKQWDETLFREYARMYVAAFATLVERTLAARADRNLPVRFLYPSSIFVTKPEVGFAEYAVAKAAGEALCDQLHVPPGVRFAKPRLPRMLTDQTSGGVDIGVVEPLPVLLDVVRRLHS